ncbi:hypothetical protein EsH8_VII_000457 [Colletotrichum jinshuiense]
MRYLLVPGLLAFLAEAQQVGTLMPEVHPKLTWKRCGIDSAGAGACNTVNGEIVLDAEWRWLHQVDGFRNCYTGNEWNYEYCNTTEFCAANCALEGADYRGSYGLTTNGSSLTQKFTTLSAFDRNINSRVFLFDGGANKYQTFTLLGNELAFDVELSSVECGINSALYFVAMDPDGGLERSPLNKAGAKYGTGYCDASCIQSNRFVDGKANLENWTPSATDPHRGTGALGACCPEFDVWNSNRHSFSTISKSCRKNDYFVCNRNCYINSGETKLAPFCDMKGCDYNPYRLNVKDFYGWGKTIDTSKKITVVTRFEETQITQFFVQDGVRFEAPAPGYPDFPEGSGLSDGYCRARADTFGEQDWFLLFGGFTTQNNVLRRPMVLAMSISNDGDGDGDSPYSGALTRRALILALGE